MTLTSATEIQGKLLDHIDKCKACREQKRCATGRALRLRIREACRDLRPL
ncbi:hypothetical protein [Streptomyces venezuelae]